MARLLSKQEFPFNRNLILTLGLMAPAHDRNFGFKSWRLKIYSKLLTAGVEKTHVMASLRQLGQLG